MSRSAGQRLSEIVVVISFAAIVSAMLVTVTDISLRLIAQGVEILVGLRPRWSISGVVDLMQLATVVSVSLAIAANFLTDSHIRIDLLLNRMGERLRGLSTVLAALTGSAVIGICLWTAWREFESQLEFTSTSATLAIPFTWYWAPLILGFAISFLCCVWYLFQAVRKLGSSLRNGNA